MPKWAGGVWPFAVVAVVAFILSTNLSISGCGIVDIVHSNRPGGCPPNAFQYFPPHSVSASVVRGMVAIACRFAASLPGFVGVTNGEKADSMRDGIAGGQRKHCFRAKRWTGRGGVDRHPRGDIDRRRKRSSTQESAHFCAWQAH